MSKFTFEEIVSREKGFLRGPFGGDLKKEIFVSKSNMTYKVYEQGVVLQKDSSIGRYYISKEYFDKKMNRFEVQPNDFLVSCSGVNYGAIFQLDQNIEKGVINQALLRIRLNNKLVDDNYFYYFFKHHLVNMIVGKKGDSTIPNFPPVSVIKKLEFNLPDINIQAKVGQLLNRLDAKIELNNKINQELEAMAKMLYDYWFVQFDFPANLQDNTLSVITERSRSRAEGYKSSGGKMVFNEDLKREVPVGWEVKKIKEVATVKAGGDKPKNFSSEKTDKYSIPIYSNGIMNDGLYGYTDVANIKEQCITISARGTIGFSVVRNEPFVPIIRLIVITPNFSGSSKYFNEYIKSLNFKRSGSVQQQLTVPQISNFNILHPSSELLKNYNDITASSINKIKLLKQQNQQLTALRDWLLPMLMNGQITLRQAQDNAVGEAEEKLSSSAEQSDALSRSKGRSMAAEPRVEYKKTDK